MRNLTRVGSVTREPQVAVKPYHVNLVAISGTVLGMDMMTLAPARGSGRQRTPSLDPEPELEWPSDLEPPSSLETWLPPCLTGS